MLSFPIVLDLETQRSFQEVSGDVRKLGVSLVGVYDYRTDKYTVYREAGFSELFTVLERASFLIGFNIDKFDLPVLSPYYIGKISQFKTLDILTKVEESLGFRVALDVLAQATLGVRKGGHGLMAINYFRNNEWAKLEKYCLEDVRITKEIYEYAGKNSKLFYDTFQGKKEIAVNLSDGGKKKQAEAVSLSLPF